MNRNGKTILVNPDARSNRDVPNLQLAYVSALSKYPVVDLNTRTYDRERYLDKKVERLVVSVQSRSLSAYEEIHRAYRDRYPEAEVKTVLGIVEVQCCYPFLGIGDVIRYQEAFSDTLPFPEYDRFDSKDLFAKKWRSGEWHYSIMTSHGCPFGCTYCASRARPWQARSAENCVEELRDARKRYGIRRFQILDDCFNVDKQHVISFCRAVQGLFRSWRCANGLRVDGFDSEMAEALRQAGCTQVNFGMESVDSEVLRVIKKGVTLEQIEAAVAAARPFFETVSGYFIIGLPGSSRESDLKAIEWCEKRRVQGFFSYFVPPEREAARDALFYGEGSSPVGWAYPVEEQREIYERAQALKRKVAGKVPGRWIRAIKERMMGRDSE